MNIHKVNENRAKRLTAEGPSERIKIRDSTHFNFILFQHRSTQNVDVLLRILLLILLLVCSWCCRYYVDYYYYILLSLPCIFRIIQFVVRTRCKIYCWHTYWLFIDALLLNYFHNMIFIVYVCSVSALCLRTRIHINISISNTFELFE